MRKEILTLLFVLIHFISFSQSQKELLVNSWVLKNATYNSGNELPIDHPLKSNYLRFDFINYEKVFKTAFPLDNGYIFQYKILNNLIKIGFVNYKIENLSKNELVLIEQGVNGFDESSIKYSFIPENDYQNKLALTNEMLIISDKDTIFIESEKIRAKFKNEKSFHSFITDEISEYSNVVSSNNYFLATFIINEKGKIDSLKIHKGINKRFDKQFLKAVEKSEKYWTPAEYDNRNVKVLHTETFEFIKNPKFEKQYFNYRDGIISMRKKEYETAINYFNISIESNPNDFDSIYQRSICYLIIDEITKACEDWEFVKKKKKVNELIEKYCK
ncbi:hypothetical protein EGM88_02960 [Aureibaculum marinum]|uniref:TonB C-terminal domain-containing protein n=1 Tax=Aureibaculum marinum TaxID=2487930 RepID=A0A3N4P946_9FLAO|nr:energy transducer TonB [Aureibaculum marinum]RPE00240.1 hypothetical protein EGM88_02960 [Aureibaculum marinum]